MAMKDQIAVYVDTKEELAGLSEAEITAAAEGAKAKGKEGKFIIEITNTTRQPALASLENREVRKKVWEASAYRGTSGETDNQPIVARLAQLRAERAKLLGYDNWATYQLEPTMAKTPKAVLDMFGFYGSCRSRKHQKRS